MAAQLPKGPCKRMNLHIRPPELAEKLKAIAFLEGISAMDLANEAIAKLIAQREKKHGAALKAVMRARKKP